LVPILNSKIGGIIISNIIKTKSGQEAVFCYLAKFSVGGGKRRIRKSKRFKTKREAQQWLSKMEVRYPGREQAMRSQLIVPDYLQLWFNAEKALHVEPATKDTYEMTRRHIEPLLAIPLGQITRPILQEAFNCLARGLSHATLLKDYSHLKAMFRAAVRNGDLAVNPCEDLVIGGNDSHVKGRDKKFMPVNDLRTIQSYLRERLFDACHVNRMVLFVVSVSGLRIGEALGLMKADIDVESGVIHVRRSYDSAHHRLKKTKSESSIRDVPIPPEDMRRVHNWVGWHEEALRTADIPNPKTLIFLNQHRHLPQAKSVNASFKLVQRTLGFKGKYTVHSFRSTLASLMVEQGVPVTYVARYLGHAPSSVVTRQYYVDVLPSAVAKDQTLAAAVVADDLTNQ